MLRDWGAEKKYHHVLKGYNYRLEGIQGAVLRVKLRHLEAWTEARRAAAARYDSLLAGSGVATPQAMPYARHVYHVYAVRTAERAGLAGRAAGAGHPDRHPLPDAGPSAAGVRRARLRAGAVPAFRAGGRTRCCRCRCSPS